MSAPVRLQLSRRKGFDLQAWSREVNGLPVVSVARPGRWGNPFDFRRSEYCWAALSFGCRGDPVGRREASVLAYREWIDPGEGRRTFRLEQQTKLIAGEKSVSLGPLVEAGEAPPREDAVAELGGRNLACWCALDGGPCHADVLLEIANP